MDKTMQDFIEENKSELLRHIKAQCPNCIIDDNDEIEDWVLNDEGLYNWAEDCGVDLT